MARFSSFLLFLAACSGPADASTPRDAAPAVTSDGGGLVDDGGDARDGGAPDDAGAGAVELTLGDWSDAPALPFPLDHHTTAVFERAAGADLVVFGGMEADERGQPRALSRQVLGAELGPEGAPGELSQRGALPIPLAFHAQAVDGATVYLVGGIADASDEGEALRLAGSGFIFFSTMDDEGMFSEWRAVAALDVLVTHGTSFIHAERLYLVGGGENPTAPHDFVLSWSLDALRSAADAEEDLAPREETPLPAPRTHHGLVITDQHVLVLTGIAPGGALTDQIWAAPLMDEELGEWRGVGSVGAPTATASFLVLDGTIVWTGGLSTGGPFDDVRAMDFRAEGDELALDTPRLLGRLPMARGHVHQTPVFAGRIYSVGGRETAPSGGQRSSTRVVWAPLGPG